MAGHSKWANIKHKKARQDKKRAKKFAKLSKKITSAARRGGGDPEFNAELRVFVDKAKDANMPKDNIERAIKKGTGELDGVSYIDFNYEGYGPGGVAIYVTGATDNRNRSVSEIRHLFDSHGGKLGEDGCVNWMFKDRGILSIDADAVDDADELMLLAVEEGALDFEQEDGVVTVTTEVSDFIPLREAVVDTGIDDFMTDEITKVADSHVSPDVPTTQTNVDLIEALEDHDDVENVYHNLELSDEAAAALQQEG
jgi:YebC/PmpR family DNA-binding regulatory protein